LAGPWLDRLPLVVRTFAITALVAPAMVFVVMPTLSRALRPWLQPQGLRFRPEECRRP
jgi:antibiotic biosynthesis monooxygenase (ABM) superfamily enzyme